jgi:TfoX/Sxy family transcriptional regulator of competence genes
MAYNEQLAERIRRSFRRQSVSFEEKRMMGGLCFMVNGKMCVGVDKDRLMARIDPAVYETVLHRNGCGPMDITGRPLRGFVFVEPAAIAADSDLAEWLKLALEFNPRAKSSKSVSKAPIKTSKKLRDVSRKSNA